jgi:hypothetical protein
MGLGDQELELLLGVDVLGEVLVLDGGLFLVGLEQGVQHLLTVLALLQLQDIFLRIAQLDPLADFGPGLSNVDSVDLLLLDDSPDVDGRILLLLLGFFLALCVVFLEVALQSLDLSDLSPHVSISDYCVPESRVGTVVTPTLRPEVVHLESI